MVVGSGSVRERTRAGGHRRSWLGRVGAIATWLGAASAAVAASGRVPVLAGGDEALDACGAIGVVAISGDAQARAAVREGPGAEYPAIDALADGTLVWLCDERDAWQGVIFGEDASACGLATPRAERAAYEGPCASGWLHRSVIRLAAG